MAFENITKATEEEEEEQVMDFVTLGMFIIGMPWSPFQCFYPRLSPCA